MFVYLTSMKQSHFLCVVGRRFCSTLRRVRKARSRIWLLSARFFSRKIFLFLVQSTAPNCRKLKERDLLTCAEFSLGGLASRASDSPQVFQFQLVPGCLWRGDRDEPATTTASTTQFIQLRCCSDCEGPWLLRLDQ